MFNNTKYTKWYYQLIESRKNIQRDCFTESHHIIPKCLGGSNLQNNKVNLTPREHFICHHLLLKMVDDLKHKKSMCCAFYKMKQLNRKGETRCSSKQYDRIREYYSHLTSGENNPFYGKGHYGENNPMSNPEVKKRHLEAVQSIEFREMMSKKFIGENNPFYGKTHSLGTKEKLKEHASQRTGENSPMWGKKHKIVSCEKCGKQITYPMYRRWHGENCKIN